jgi:hypothetical protein
MARSFFINFPQAGALDCESGGEVKLGNNVLDLARMCKLFFNYHIDNGLERIYSALHYEHGIGSRQPSLSG